MNSSLLKNALGAWKSLEPIDKYIKEYSSTPYTLDNAVQVLLKIFRDGIELFQSPELINIDQMNLFNKACATWELTAPKIVSLFGISVAETEELLYRTLNEVSISDSGIISPKSHSDNIYPSGRCLYPLWLVHSKESEKVMDHETLIEQDKSFINDKKVSIWGITSLKRDEADLPIIQHLGWMQTLVDTRCTVKSHIEEINKKIMEAVASGITEISVNSIVENKKTPVLETPVPNYSPDVDNTPKLVDPRYKRSETKESDSDIIRNTPISATPPRKLRKLNKKSNDVTPDEEELFFENIDEDSKVELNVDVKEILDEIEHSEVSPKRETIDIDTGRANSARKRAESLKVVRKGRNQYESLDLNNTATTQISNKSNNPVSNENHKLPILIKGGGNHDNQPNKKINKQQTRLTNFFKKN